MAKSISTSGDNDESNVPHAWAIQALNATKLPEMLPSDVFSMNLSIHCHAALPRTPMKFRDRQDDGTLVERKFDQPDHCFPIYETDESVIWIPNRVIPFINPLEVGRVTKEHKQTPRRDSLGRGYENDRRKKFEDFHADLRTGISAIEMREDSEAAERVYLGDYRLCSVPSEYVETDPDVIEEKGGSPYDDRGIKWELYDDEVECWIVEFGQVANENVKVNIHADEDDETMNAIVPGKTTVPCLLTSITRVRTKPMRGRDMSKVRKAYYQSEKEVRKKNKPLGWEPKTWELKDDLSNLRQLNSLFEDNLPSLAAIATENPPLFTKVPLEGKFRRRDIFDVDGR